MKDLQGKLALVTGGAKGVGKVIATLLAERGAHVLINFFHSLDAAKQTKAELEALGGKVDIIRASVALEAQVDRMFDQIEAEYGYLDILINNAASGSFTALDAVDSAAFDRSLDTNLKGSFWCARRAARLMERRGGGVIVNLSSIGAVQVAADYVTVGTSKAAVESLTRYLAYEFGPQNIRVNTASAGLLENEVGRRFPKYEEMRRNIIEATPLGRIGTERELADLVLFLASDQSRYITGQMILADGGMSLGGSILSPRSPRVETPVSETSAPTIVDDEVDESEEIAVVGMGMVVPGANSPEEFWQVLTDGPDLLRYVPRERWENRSFYSPDGDAEDKTYQNTSGFITDFKPAPGLAAEAELTEQNTELTTLWLRHSLYQALEGVKRKQADRYSFVVGYTPDGNQHLEESMVIASTMHHLDSTLAGVPGSEPFLKQARAALEQEYWRGAFDPSALLPHQVGRKAMQGVLPEQTELLMVDTACSSSLYAIDIGIKGLLTGKHDIAVCGGSFALGPRSSVLFAKLHGLSTSGQVRPLDKQADGVLFSDGSGVVVLKKLKRALKDGDPILGIIRGLGTSSDGKGRAIYAPSPDGQGIAIDRALAQPAVDLDRVDWVVAHATGTPAGDLTEFTALRERLQADHPIAVTSNKSLIGHTGWAAGVASLIQVLLALRHGIIPPQHHFDSTPELFKMEGSNLTIPKEPIPWSPRPESPRAAAVSGFGFGGTNAHVVVEEYKAGASHTPPAPERAYGERIAVVGWAAHVPGLENAGEVTRWLTGEGKAPLASFGEFYPAPSFQKVKMPPKTVRTIDRCQLMILECAHNLRDQLGKFWEDHRETTGVVLGHMGLTRHSTLYGTRCYLDDIERVLRGSLNSPLLEQGLRGLRQEVQRLVPASNEDSFPGIMPNVIPARVANYFDLKGANMALDTGFASSVSAMEVACRYLRSNEMSMVLTGGVNGNSTPETVAAIRQHLKETGVEIGEGCFLFALVTESTAQAAGLPVLGFLDEGAGNGARVACGVGAGNRTYMGAEGALGLLKALVSPEPEVTVACRTEDETLNLHLTRESAPKKNQVQRYESYLAPVAGQAIRPAIPFLSAETAIVTDRPDLLPADTRGALVITPETDPATIEARPHLRVLTTLDQASLTRLHDLAFLALKQSFGGLKSFIGLFPGMAGHPMTGLYTGLFKSAALELPACATAAIFTDTADIAEAVRLAELESSYKQMLPYVLYEGAVRKTQLVRQSDGELAAEPPLGPDSVVVATAGARGITAELLKAVAREYRPHLFLIGSNDLNRYPAEVFQGTDAEFSARRPAYLKEQKAIHPQKSIGQLNKEFDRMAEARQARRNIEEMERYSGKGKVRYLACNVLDREALTAAIRQIRQEAGRPVDLLINAAGLNRSASIPAKSLQDFQTIREIKLSGYLNLKHAFASELPRMWCNFGSFIGLTGQLGETDYAAGNDFLATAALHAQAQGQQEFTIGWTLWKTVGMGANPVTRAFLEKSAVFTSMETEEGVAHFLRELRLQGRAPATFHLGEAERNAVTAAIPEYFTTKPTTERKPGTFYLGRELHRTDDEVTFERVFDLENDAYLQHHVVNGYATLPGTFVPELAAEAASALLPGQHVIAFEDAVFHHFLRVYDKSKPSAKKIHARVIDRGEGQTRVQVRITTDVVAPNGTVLTRDKLHFEITVILSETAPLAPSWVHWDAAGEEPLPDPYHFPTAPVLLTDMFVSTEKTRRHPLGKRATYKLNVAPGHPVFSNFLVPSILLDGLARVAVLEPTENDYLPIAAPASIRRIDLYEMGSDCQVAQRYQGVEFYATPAHIDLEKPASNRFLAVRPDGRVLLQMKDVRGVVIGYLHRTTGEFISPGQMEEVRRQNALLKV